MELEWRIGTGNLSREAHLPRVLRDLVWRPALVSMPPLFDVLGAGAVESVRENRSRIQPLSLGHFPGAWGKQKCKVAGRSSAQRDWGRMHGNRRNVFFGHGNRPRHGEYAGLCQGQGGHPERAVGGGLLLQGRAEEDPGGRGGRPVDAGPHAGQHPGNQAVARWRHCRFRCRGIDDQGTHQEGAQARVFSEAARDRLRAARGDAGRKARDPAVRGSGGRQKGPG